MISILFFIAVAIQFFYLNRFFGPLLRSPKILNTNKEPVSIIIAAKNEEANLKQLIPELLKQNYPSFEIIVAVNNSTDGSIEMLKQFGQSIKVLDLGTTEKGKGPKKIALIKAVETASQEVLLFTDADCMPASKNWISGMVEQLSGDIVLGFSPYKKKNGFLNSFIQYETFQTALLYLGLAKAGHPFMGVGRNLMYRKKLFNGYKKHLHLMSGDDDLFINEVATKQNTNIAVNPDTFVFSEPKTSFTDWKNQKLRHLSVGGTYKLKDRVLLGLYWFSLMGVILLGIFNFKWLLVFLFAKLFIPFYNLNYRLAKPLNLFQLFVFEFIFPVYLMVFGLITLFSPKKRDTW